MKPPSTSKPKRGVAFVPDQRLAWLFALPLCLGLIAIADESIVPAMISADVAILVVALGDAFFARAKIVSVRREAPRFLSVGRKNTIWLVVTAKRACTALIKDDRSPELSPPMTPVRMQIANRQTLRLRYVIEPQKRGRYTVGGIHVRVRSPLGLVWRQYEIPQVDTARVYPDVQAVRRYELLLRRNVDTARAVRRRGGESEFERLRDYNRDDDYRAIDWKATARKHRLIARELQQERNQQVVCVLECGRMMSAMSGGLEQLDHALNASLMLAHVAGRAGDRVGLLAFAEHVQRFLAPTSGSAAVRRVLGAGFDLRADLVEPSYESAFAVLSERVKKRSLIVLFTQVHDVRAGGAVLRLVKRLAKSHLVLCCLLRDRDLDTLADSAANDGLEHYEAAAAAELVLAAEHHARDLEAQGALVLSVDPKHLTPALIDRYLEIKVRQMI